MHINIHVTGKRTIAFILVFSLLIVSTGCTTYKNGNDDTSSDTVTGSDIETNTTSDIDDITEADTAETQNESEYQTITEENVTYAVYADHAVVIGFNDKASTFLIKPYII